MSETVLKSEGRPQTKYLKPYKKGEAPQPTPEQKKAGRDRKRHAQKIMEYILQYQTMTKEELEEKSKDKSLTILELTMIRYVVGGMKNDKFLLDMIDRHVPKAPQQVEVSGPDSGPVQIDQETKDKIKGMIGGEVVE